MIDIIEGLCKEKHTNITALCKEVTGSTGNLPTWRKGNIRTDYLLKIADKFDVSTDYLLGKTNIKKPAPTNGDELRPALSSIMERVQRLSPDNLSKLSELIDLFLNSQGNKK